MFYISISSRKILRISILSIITILFCNTLLVAQMIKLNPSQALYDNLLPKAQKVEYQLDKPAFILNGDTKIISDNEFLNQYLSDRIANVFGSKPLAIKSKKARKDDTNYIFLTVNRKALKKSGAVVKEEAYSLSVSEKGVTIIGADYGGMFNGVQTLLQLLPAKVYNFENKDFIAQTSIPQGVVKDWPKYNYRGFELDVARTWRPAEDVYKVLEWMAYNKINKFHWHLTDDEGWRIEIKAYPELTEKGAFRGPGEIQKAIYGSGNKRYGGYYTQEQVKDIVKFAAERNIEIIPEIEMPGHSRAIALCHPEITCQRSDSDTIRNKSEFSREIWCVAKENNYTILENILKEMAALFPTKTLNIGGDEVNHLNWHQCPDCKALKEREGLESDAELHNYFVRRIDKIVHKYGKRLAGWEELMEAGKIDPATLIYVWKSANATPKAIKGEHYAVLQVGEYSYLDMQQSALERGHNWAGIVPLEKTYSQDLEAIATPKDNDKTPAEYKKDVEKYIVGVQGGLWEELGNRPVNFVEYQAFPRLCAIAEVGWGTKEDFAGFNKRLTQAHYERMNNMHIRYRVPYPVVMATANADGTFTITAESPYEGAVVKYAFVAPETEYQGIRGTADTICYKNVYTKPLTVNDIANYRFATFTSATNHSISVAVSNLPLYQNQQKPEFTLETNRKFKEKFSIDDLLGYNPMKTTYFEGNAQKGDYWTVTFKEPVKCSVLDIRSSRTAVDLNGIPYGYVEYSYDGVNYIKGGEFNCNRSVTRLDNSQSVKSFRIVVSADGDTYQTAMQPFIIY